MVRGSQETPGLGPELGGLHADPLGRHRMATASRNAVTGHGAPRSGDSEST